MALALARLVQTAVFATDLFRPMSLSPLVSIVVRSVGRDTLPKALDSIAEQRWPNLEIVVVCASGSTHPRLPDVWKHRPLRQVRAAEPLPRSIAANLGLDACHGELIGFLDDDDWLLPHHVDTLAECLLRSEAAVAAYARVSAVDESGGVLRQFGQPFDSVALHAENHLPIHSVLFRRAPLDVGLRFDPEFDLCEDWDFWCRLSETGPFVFVDQLTAFYRIHSAGGFALQGDRSAAIAAERQVVRRWLARPEGEALFYEIVVRARAWTEMQLRRRANEQLEQQIRALREDLAAAHQEVLRTVERYETSRSWRVTVPLRRAAGVARKVKRALIGFRRLDGARRLKVLAWLATGNFAAARATLAMASAVEIARPDRGHRCASAPEMEKEPVIPLPPPAPVDVMIPVYNGFEFLEPLFDSLQAADTVPYRLVVCDDASPDDRVWPWLVERLGAFPGAVLLRNDENLGFVGTVNRMFECATGDFILLNTDVEVPAGWIERLMAPMGADPSVASVTPFTNAGTICSFPEFFVDNPLPEGMTVHEVDRVFARLKGVPAQEIPTAVGFCMAIRYEVAARIGMFDPAFGRGYREENDWCRRAQLAGYKHLLATNLFVLHKHGGSFAPEDRQALADRNEVVLRERYPDVFALYQEHIRRDPAWPLRAFLDFVILAERSRQPAFVMIDNTIEGGAMAYGKQRHAAALAEGKPVLRLVDDFRTGELRAELETTAGARVLYFGQMDEWTRLLQALDVGEIFVNNVYSWRAPMRAALWLASLRRSVGAPLVIALHDFYMTCPSLFLIDSQRRYCGIPDASACAKCLPGLPADFPHGAADVGEWRRAWGAAFGNAHRILAFSESTAGLFRRAFPDHSHKVEVKPHSMAGFNRRPLAVDVRAPLHIGIVGAISWHKGWGVVKRLCELIDRRNAPVRVTVIGTLVPEFSANCLNVTGRYPHGALAEWMAESGANVFFFASIWPETFSYVAHEIIACGLPLACFDLGAPADAVRHYPLGKVLESDDPERMLADLESFREDLRHRPGD